MPPRLKPQIPHGAPLVPTTRLSSLARKLSACKAVTVLTGAGISTESGLSDYRSPGKLKPSRPPINHHEYIKSASVRRRYWARSFVGYSVLSQAHPGLAHHALTALQREGGNVFKGHVTQNVDGLLQKAGMEAGELVELHGNIHGLYCRECEGREGREEFQTRLEEVNLDWRSKLKSFEYRADGDAELDGGLLEQFRVPECVQCGVDALMPSIVFHGGGVDKEVAERAGRMVREGDGLLVVGSTVQLWSAWRLVKAVREKGGVAVCINFGPTRGDGVWDVKVEGLIGDAVMRLTRMLLGRFQVPEHLKNVYQKDDDGVVRTLQL